MCEPKIKFPVKRIKIIIIVCIKDITNQTVEVNIQTPALGNSSLKKEVESSFKVVINRGKDIHDHPTGERHVTTLVQLVTTRQVLTKQYRKILI